MPRQRRFDPQFSPVPITAVLVLIIVAALAAPRLPGNKSERAGSSGPQGSDESGAQAPPSAGPQVFRYYSEQLGTLDPALAADAYSSIVIAQIFSPLVGLTSDLEPVPQLAESWTISRDGLVYLF